MPGLHGAKRIKMSQDGLHLYVPSSTSDAIVVMGRNPADGTLTHIQTLVDDIGGIDGLDNTDDLVLSPDGQNVYCVGGQDDAIAVFNRNSGTGMLTQIQLLMDTAQAIDGLNGATGVAVSPDGKSVYVAGANDDAIAVFSRESVAGMLTFEEVHLNGLFGIDGLNAVNDVKVSDNGLHVYTISATDDAVSVFSRDTATTKTPKPRLNEKQVVNL